MPFDIKLTPYSAYVQASSKGEDSPEAHRILQRASVPLLSGLKRQVTASMPFFITLPDNQKFALELIQDDIQQVLVLQIVENLEEDGALPLSEVKIDISERNARAAQITLDYANKPSLEIISNSHEAGSIKSSEYRAPTLAPQPAAAPSATPPEKPFDVFEQPIEETPALPQEAFRSSPTTYTAESTEIRPRKIRIIKTTSLIDGKTITRPEKISPEVERRVMQRRAERFLAQQQALLAAEAALEQDLPKADSPQCALNQESILQPKQEHIS